MRHSTLFIICLTLLTLTTATLSAQHGISNKKLQSVAAAQLPLQNNDALRAEELKARRPGRPNTFAVTMPTNLRPETSGNWEVNGTTSTWRLRIPSPGARTLNLGFSEYQLPNGAELRITTEKEQLGPFTKADNAEHNQFWTPLVAGDELLLTLTVPTKSRKKVQLYLTSVNHDFIDVTKALSGSCNLDVVCGADDGWAIVDDYRDIIRSVAAYTLNGRDQCTGFLVNNANEDGRPFFMTANHCNVREDNAAGVVAYWNFESPTCRQPGSVASGQIGVGSRDVFNSGTIFRSASANSDMCLLEFDEPVNPNADAFFAGWTLDETTPTSLIIAVHHPGVDEKRISFTDVDLVRTNANRNDPSPTGRYLVVPNWEIGTTEGGSSGSPIFDTNKHVRGQLWRGLASCEAPEEYDQYGFFTSSWEGDGTPDSRLKDWLDPCGTGLFEIDGFNQSALSTTLLAEENCIEVCPNSTRAVTISAGVGFPNNATATIVSSPDVLTAELSTTRVSGGEEFELLLSQAATPGTYTLVVRLAGGGVSDEVTLTVTVTDDVPPVPTLVGPAAEATEISPLTLFSWMPNEGATSYGLQISRDPDFGSLLASVPNLTGTAAAPDVTLLSGVTYYWRLRTNTGCGNSEWVTSSFTVAEGATCGRDSAPNVPIEITPSGTPTVTASLNVSESFIATGIEIDLLVQHTYVGDLEASLRGPDGTTIRLFTEIDGGGCREENLNLRFSDDATATADDLSNTCNSGQVFAVEGVFQSRDPLASLLESDVQGDWTLILNDNAPADGGNILNFRINFCTGAGDIEDFSFSTVDSDWVACLNTESSFNLNLGTSYTDDATITATTQLGALTEFTTTIDEATNAATLTFTGWNELAAGDYVVTLAITAEEGVIQTTTVPLLLGQTAQAVSLVAPQADARLASGTNVEFEWLRGLGADSYSLQLALNEQFTGPDANTIDVGLAETLTIPDLEAGRTYYWRVITNNELCGSVISPTRQFTIRPVGTYDFGGGSSVSLYPNPATDVVVVDLKGAWPDAVNGTLYDAAGRRLRDYRVDQAGRTQWNVGGLSQGVYFLRLTSGVRHYTERLIIK